MSWPHRPRCRNPTSNIQRRKVLIASSQGLVPRVNLAAEDFLATAVVHYTAAAVTDRGRKRPSNEDAFGYSVEAGSTLFAMGWVALRLEKSPAPWQWMRFFAN